MMVGQFKGLAVKAALPGVILSVLACVGLGGFQTWTSKQALHKGLAKERASYRVVETRTIESFLLRLGDQGHEILARHKEMTSAFEAQPRNIQEIRDSYTKSSLNVLNNIIGGTIRRTVFCDGTDWNVILEEPIGKKPFFQPGDSCRSPFVEAGVKEFLKKGSKAAPIQGLSEVDGEVVLTRFFPVTKYDRKARGRVLRLLIRVDAGLEDVLAALKEVASAKEIAVQLGNAEAAPVVVDGSTKTATMTLPLSSYEGNQIGYIKLDKDESSIIDANTAQLWKQLGVLILVFVALGALNVFFLKRSVIAPVAEMTDLAETMAEGDYSVSIRGASREDEIGHLAAALEVFRKNAVEAERLEKEAIETRKRFEEERLNQEQMLEIAIGDIVAAAAAGDLKRRIDVANLEGVMGKLGDGVNRLLGSMESVIDEVGSVLSLVAEGDLTQRMVNEYQGAFLQLKTDANTMIGRMAETVGQVAEATEMVAGAAAEIARGSDDLASRTENQASSLEETAAATEQLTSTVRENSQAAKEASAMAMEASATAARGGDVVEQAMEAMGRIVASSEKINEIVGMIDEIAFQTNLLALNAAVEAARAGEAGKGFAVVAQEVRSLSQRSSEASKEIKDLVENSGREVEAGSALVERTRATLTEIVTAIKAVSGTVDDIATASADQAGNLSEVSSAISNMDQSTQQNAALVEETTASANSMSEQSQALKNLVSHFRLDAYSKAAE